MPSLHASQSFSGVTVKPVISPAWSIHSACATHNYTFIWGMAGENLDYGDMDTCAVTDLK